MNWTEKTLPWPSLEALAVRAELREIEQVIAVLQRRWKDAKERLDRLELKDYYIQHPQEHLLREEP